MSSFLLFIKSESLLPLLLQLSISKSVSGVIFTTVSYHVSLLVCSYIVLFCISVLFPSCFCSLNLHG